MLNRSPIFLNCFSRGGSNIFWNIFLTHPDVCSPILETLEIFSLRPERMTRSGLQVALLSGQLRLFDQWNFSPRKPLNPRAQHFIERTLYDWKLKTLHDEEMRYKAEDQVYTAEEVQNARLAAKNNNGLIFLSDVLRDIFPDATFFALVRHPLPLYESHKRHKTPPSRSVQSFAAFYNRMVARIVIDRERFSNYHVVRFEDILSNPTEVIPKLYDLAHLDTNKVHKVRFKAKPHYQANGRHTSLFQPNRHYWLEWDEVTKFLEPQVNDYQIAHLEPKERILLLNLTEQARVCFGYA